MAEQDSTTTGQEPKETAPNFWFTAAQDVIPALRTIRAIGDLLTAAADSVGQGRNEFHESTLAEIGCHLEDLATEALATLRWEEPKPQAAAQGGV
jgi:hypothetical protein